MRLVLDHTKMYSLFVIKNIIRLAKFSLKLCLIEITSEICIKKIHHDFKPIHNPRLFAQQWLNFLSHALAARTPQCQNTQHSSLSHVSISHARFRHLRESSSINSGFNCVWK